MGRSLLAVFAHPDDESYGPGGTFAKYTAQGVAVHLLCATRGEEGTLGNPPICTREELGRVREEELRCACQALSIKEVRFMGYWDGTLDREDPSQVEEKIVRAIRETRPQIILTFPPDGVSGHLDHMMIHRCTTAAYHHAGDEAFFPKHFEEGLQPCSPAKLYYVALPGEMIRSLGVDFQGHDEHITTVIDVSQQVETKMRAISCHRTQLDFPKLTPEQVQQYLSKEYFWLAHPALYSGIKETDLFQRMAA
ncbi:MAG: PIG-L deacetylase family protein [Dehalococcoidia bacterium]|nr:PIG-L deacetylase family protein [Dehalococcoidia bacterium]